MGDSGGSGVLRVVDSSKQGSTAAGGRPASIRRCKSALVMRGTAISSIFVSACARCQLREADEG